MPYMKIFAAAVLVLSMVDASRAGSVYRWVDKQGNTHYTDHLPPDTSGAPVHVDSAPASGDAAAAAAAKPAKATDNSDECQKIKDKLTNYKAASKISETDALGNTREYSDEERQKLIDLTAQKVKAACGE
jgi:hypothetical protein